MALTETRPTADTVVAAPRRELSSDAGAVERMIGTGDHLSIGRAFILFSLVFGLVSAAGLLLTGIDTATDNGLLGSAAGLIYASSGLALVLAGAIPLLLGAAIYLVPLQVGSPSISFPRAASLSLWAWLVGVVLFATSVALDGGVAGADADAARLGNLAVGMMMASLAMGAVTVVTTVVTHRPLGMGLGRTPLFAWSMLVAGPIWILNLAGAFSGVLLGEVSRLNAPGLAANYSATVSWLLSAPAVYMLAIPVLGIAGDIAAKASGRRIESYGIAQGLIAAFGVLSFGAWTQTPRALQTFVFIVWVIVAGLPVLALLGLFADTMRRSRPTLSAAVISVPTSLLLIFGGVLAAALQGIDTTGKGTLAGFEASMLQSAQLYFLVGAALTGALGALALWSDKLWGESMDSTSKLAVTAVFAGSGILGLLPLVQGIMAPSTTLQNGVYGSVLAIGGALVLVGLIGGLLAALNAGRAGHDGPAQPDKTGLTLEWATESPPEAARLLELPVVRSPYPLLDLREADNSDEETK